MSEDSWHFHTTSLGSEEAFWPAEHRTFAEIRAANVKGKLPIRYQLKTDKERLTCLKLPNGEDMLCQEIPITTLRHVTTSEGAENICLEQGFRGGKRQLGLVTGHFSWWAVLAEKTQQVHKLLALLNTREGIFKESRAFIKDEAHQYGNYAFDYTYHDLITAYCSHWGTNKPVLRIFGTFLYKQEVMYAVLAHSPDHNSQFCNLTRLNEGTAGQQVKKGNSDDQLLWCPESVVGIIVPPFSAYETLAFAFHLPGNGIFRPGDDTVKHLKIVDCKKNPEQNWERTTKMVAAKNFVKKHRQMRQHFLDNKIDCFLLTSLRGDSDDTSDVDEPLPYGYWK